MKYLTIDDIKQQLRLDFDCEAALLELYGQGAEDTVLYLCNRTYENIIGTYGEVPAAIRQATLELVTNSYEQRSPASPTNLSAVPYNFDLLIKPYMLLHGTPLKNERNRIIDSLQGMLINTHSLQPTTRARRRKTSWSVSRRSGASLWPSQSPRPSSSKACARRRRHWATR